MSESRAELDARPVRGDRNRGLKSKKVRRWEEWGNSQEKRRTRLHSEKQACPRRGNPTAVKTVLNRRQTERGGKALWDAEEFDCHLARCWDTHIASEPLSPRETRVGTLRTRK